MYGRAGAAPEKEAPMNHRAAYLWAHRSVLQRWAGRPELEIVE